ncbi:hypothetical protein [Hymenobacter canadensis]|uniref:DUF695 domain-containing protein n=1 Tax=Hymenobacter canadensis TaxID=2999067 RepID=A0ABY7LQL5_9BACT|nr:hypothetical protein [Hymenobacter canadensis]WBA41737.1 hypothetical protein O3303_18240 [Hymenobacter canadensis]
MYFTAGYYLVIPKHERGTVNGYTFISRVWSVSTYISYVYPSNWGFSWEYSKRQVPKNFSLAESELTKLHACINALFEQSKYGAPGFFFEQKDALAFQEQFLSDLPQVRLLGIFLHESHCSTANAEVEPHTSPDWPTLATLLQQRVPEPEAGLTIGFDLLGLFDYGGYEPFSYHVLEEEYHTLFSIELNEYGLFPGEADCQRVASYTDTIADEPATWLPFKVKLFT